MHFPYSVSRGWEAKTSPVADEPQVTDPYPLAGVANLTEHPFHRVSTLSDALQTVFTQLNLCFTQQQSHSSPLSGTATTGQHGSPFHALMPSFTAMTAITSAAIGSAHDQPSTELSSKPTSKTAER